MARFAHVPRQPERKRIEHVFETQGLRVAVCRYRPGDTVQRLTCPDGQLWLALSGQWGIETPTGERLRTRPLRAQYFAGGTQHLRELESQGAVMLGIQIPHRLLPEGWSDVPVAPAMATQPYLDLLFEVCRQDDGWQARLAEQTLQLATSLQGPAVGPDFPGWLRAVKRALREPDAPPFEVLATQHGVSAAHLSTTFRRAFGETMTAYVERVRRTRALALLCDAELSIGEVAAQAGYYDHAHFGKAFKAHTQMAPREFRDFVGIGSRG